MFKIKMVIKNKANAIVGQSGGPTAAINATLSGIIRGALKNENIDKIYGMINGIEGLLKGKIKELNDIFKTEENLSLLENTPAAALGSCRKKLPDVHDVNNGEIYKKIFDILNEKNIKYFFYIGGNDSMDTVRKLSYYAKNHGINDIYIIGVPKTVDNDLYCTDHSPGYGSAAKYIAATIQEICHDNAVYDMKSVVIVEIMGRDAGWLTAAAALPRFNCGKAANLLYLPEVEFSDYKFISDIEKEFETHSDIVIAVSEGVKYANGKYVCEVSESRETDIFGHTWLSGTANRLKYVVKDKLNCKVRSIELNTPQRCASHIASLCDLTESSEIGQKAVETAISRQTGVMMTFNRISTQPYKTEIGYENVDNIANKIKYVPLEYINEYKNNVTDECLKYIQPLITGEPKLLYKDGLPVFFTI